jgi:hypothetical protein
MKIICRFCHWKYLHVYFYIIKYYDFEDGGGKGKVVPVLNYAMKTYGGVDVYIHVFLTSALIRGEWSASRCGRSYYLGKNPQYTLNRRLGGPQSRFGQCEEEKILDPTGT